MATQVYTIRCVGCGSGGDHSLDLHNATDSAHAMAMIAELVEGGHIAIVGPKERFEDEYWDAATGNSVLVIDPDMVHSNWRDLN